MNDQEKTINYEKIIPVVVLVLLALISFFVMPRYASQIGQYEKTSDSIDNKLATVEKLTAASMSGSTILSAMPSDICNPIADQLAEFVDSFLLIMSVLLAEKYLMGFFGDAAFKIIIPLACLIGLIWAVNRKEKYFQYALKVGLFGIILFMLVPTSVLLSDRIYEQYESSFDETVLKIGQLQEETSEYLEETNDNWLKSFFSKIGKTAKDFGDEATAVVNKMVQATAVMFVVSCGIPMITLLFLLWLIKTIFNLDITISKPIVFRKARRSFKETVG